MNVLSRPITKHPVALPDITFLIQLGVVKPAAPRVSRPNYRPMRLSATEYTRLRRSKFKQLGLTTHGTTPIYRPRQSKNEQPA